MKSQSSFSALAVSFLALTTLTITLATSASAHEMVLPAGTLLKCTMDEPNLSSATVAVGDPVLCHLHSVTEFGRQTFPRGSYLVGHLESAKDPGHFWGKGDLKLVFDRIGMPDGDMPLDAKVIATRGYKVNKEGDIRGKGHATRDVVEWMIPPLWPWKIIMLPARGPRPTLKGESQLTLRLMDDVQIPQVAQTNGPDWRFFGRPEPTSDSYYHGAAYNSSNNNVSPQLAVRRVTPASQNPPRVEEIPQVTYASYITKDDLGGGGVSSVAMTSGATGGVSNGVPVFVLKTGMILSVGNYTYQEGRISYELASGGSGVISTDEVDWNSTTRLNSQRGVRVTLRPGHPNPTSGF